MKKVTANDRRRAGQVSKQAQIAAANEAFEALLREFAPQDA